MKQKLQLLLYNWSNKNDKIIIIQENNQSFRGTASMNGNNRMQQSNVILHKQTNTRPQFKSSRTDDVRVSSAEQNLRLIRQQCAAKTTMTGLLAFHKMVDNLHA